LDVLYGGLGTGKLQFLIKKIKFFFQLKFFSNFWSFKALDPDWIRIGFQPKMLDPDEMNADPQP
jgi:hypothetical protein